MNSNFFFGMALVAMLFIPCGIIILSHYYIASKCIKCGRPGATQEIGRSEVEREKGWIMEKGKDNQDVIIPGYKVTYEVMRKCKFCGYTFTYLESKEEIA